MILHGFQGNKQTKKCVALVLKESNTEESKSTKMKVGGVKGWEPNALVAAGLSKECTTIFSLYLGILISGTISSNYGV